MRPSPGMTVGALAIAVGLAAAIWAFLPGAEPVDTALVTRGTFVATVDEDGKTRIRERYVIAAPLSGRLSRVRYKAGDRVAAGDAIATILPALAPLLDPRSRREAEERLGAVAAALDGARAGMERARAQAVQARSEVERTQELTTRGAATVQALERTQLAERIADREARAAEFRYHATEHELASARALLARYIGPSQEPGESWTVTSPVSGVVLRVAQESETAVQAGMSILEIGDPRDLEIIVDVLSTDAVEIRQGAKVALTNWGQNVDLEGRVRVVEPAAFTKISTLGVEEQRVNVRIDLVSPYEHWQGLGDGYKVDARIEVFAQDNSTIVPSGALFRRGERWHVFVVEDGRAQLRSVTLTRRAGRLAAVASGLSPGDVVIVYPADRIAGGSRVRPR